MTPALSRSQRRQIIVITAVAIAIYVAFRFLPTGTNLSHMDFRAGKGSIEFCDPSNPQFIPVVNVRSPVSMTLTTATPARTGERVIATLALRTSSGKPVESQDLLLSHTRKLHLLIVDPSLGDYQHVHPEASEKPGEWSFSFTPRGVGSYRVFADFTPRATARGLYASADLPVEGLRLDSAIFPGRPRGSAVAVMFDGYRFELTPAARPVRAGLPTELKFSISREDGANVPLHPVMDAYAHLVAFDRAITGFAHLHPNESDLTKPPHPTKPELTFKLTIPQAGEYVIWSQVNLAGREVFAPFQFEVLQ